MQKVLEGKTKAMNKRQALLEKKKNGFLSNETVSLDVDLGQFKIKNVPHTKLSHPSPSGNDLVRELDVTLNIGRLYKYMEQEKIYELDYNNIPFGDILR
jgi:hypothetical protein